MCSQTRQHTHSHIHTRTFANTHTLTLSQADRVAVKRINYPLKANLTLIYQYRVRELIAQDFCIECQMNYGSWKCWHRTWLTASDVSVTRIQVCWILFLLNGANFWLINYYIYYYIFQSAVDPHQLIQLEREWDRASFCWTLFPLLLSESIYIYICIYSDFETEQSRKTAWL